MRINLFWKRIFRIVQPTNRFEHKIASVQTSSDEGNVRFDNELNDKVRLEQLIQSPEFLQKRELYKTRKYKDTDEYRIVRQYEKLANDENLKRYYQIKNSNVLQEYVDFKSNPDSLNLKNLSILEISQKIEKLKVFEQSKEYKIYTQYHDSLVVREFEELKRKISEPEFQRANAFWADPERWESTYEYRMEMRYNELSGNLQSVRQKKKTFLFKKYSHVKLTFNESFNWNKLEESRWMSGFHSENPLLIGNYSFSNEWQANNHGHNVSVNDGILTIRTTQEPVESLAWDVQKGFRKKEFQYAADVIQTSASFHQKYGIFSAKIRCSGAVHHAVWLKGTKKLPHINLFYYDGKNISVGNANQHTLDGAEIEGIPENQFFIYTLEWTARSLTWYINNVEIYRTTENIPHKALYLGIHSFLPRNSEPSTGTLEVDWIKVFSVKE